MKQFTFTDIARTAELSDCQRFRYQLTRCWRPEAPQLGWIMLNPSTADALQDDPTIRRCMGFARAWDFGGIVVANLFHLRATDPSDLVPPDLENPKGDPLQAAYRIIDHAVGIAPDDDWYGNVLACARVIVAWGSHDVVRLTARDTRIRMLATARRQTLHALAVNADGQPRHPLYVRGDAKPIVWFDPAAPAGGSGE